MLQMVCVILFAPTYTIFRSFAVSINLERDTSQNDHLPCCLFLYPTLPTPDSARLCSEMSLLSGLLDSLQKALPTLCRGALSTGSRMRWEFWSSVLGDIKWFLFYLFYHSRIRKPGRLLKGCSTTRRGAVSCSFCSSLLWRAVGGPSYKHTNYLTPKKCLFSFVQGE